MSIISKAKSSLSRASQYPHAEREFAAELGVAQSVLKDVRDGSLSRGVDWQLVKNEICYSDEGQKKLSAALEVPDSAPNGPAGVSAPTPAPAAVQAKGYRAPKAGEIRILKVVRTVRNRHCVAAVDGEVPAWVRVKDSRKFSGGMELKAKFLEGDRWIIEGRGPRFRGRY